MAAVQQLLVSPSPAPASVPSQRITSQSAESGSMDVDSSAGNDPVMIDSGLMKGAPQTGDARIVVIVYGQGQDSVVSVFAEVLGKPVKLKQHFKDVGREDEGFVIGLPLGDAKHDVEERDQQLLVAINAHCVDLGMPPDLHLSIHCDYEFLYTETPFSRRDLARFISFTLGQTSPHSQLMAKSRTFFISTTFPDVHAALPNLDILTVGADAVEIRVDLLREPKGDGAFSDIPSLSYVGQQVMLLRQRTELPIIFTTRCTNENGKFPMDKPDLYYEYLYRAVQWGVEYIDVELWLPEHIRKKLYEKRGNSRIMSAFHDFSGTFKWPSQYAQDVFVKSKQYADIVKMIAIINDHNENFELEYFRSKIKAEYPDAPPLSAVNMGEIGQFSRTLNTVFSPITHPLLPIIAAPGQMSTAEINGALALLGQLPKKYFYGISSAAARNIAPRAPFYEKCFNELGLPHQFAVVERQHNNPAGIQAWCNQRDFGGAYLDPGLSYQTIMRHNPWFATLQNGKGPILSEAAQGIGIIDTIVVKPVASGLNATPPSQYDGALPPGGQPGLTSNTSLVFDNASWRGILSALTRDLAPSAYFDRTAVVLALTADDAAPVFFALKALKMSKIYTVGFRTPSTLARNAPPIEQFISMESLQRARSVADNRAPFVIISALGRGKSNIVGMLLRVFGEADPEASSNTKKVFLNLAEAASHQKNDPVAVAEQSGFTAYDAADVAAFTTVESLRLLVGQNVPYSFVRLASGRNLF
ncbi:hypothetical protein MKX08_000797 [Trichoderma sp. CBMAI-0020]|nr:hypothetical protein MKX08_000797 [Trichoderma sp. CBMAI-0020]WOD46439.1 hypothetical protein [Trichoderma atroviride]